MSACEHMISLDRIVNNFLIPYSVAGLRPPVHSLSVYLLRFLDARLLYTVGAATTLAR